MEEKKSKSMTIEEFDKLPEDNTYTYELIDGELIMQARPNIKHQDIMRVLSGELYNYLKNRSCKAFTEVELEINKNVIVPDISVLCDLANSDGQRFKETPILVVEILSPSNTTKEINNKIFKYKNHGIKECWIVDPDIKTIEVKNLINNADITYIQSGLIKSNIFSDLVIDLANVFE